MPTSQSSSSTLTTSKDFRSIVLENTPLIDVRAPKEYAKGSFPNTVNLPLMNDQERHEVGIEYKHKGNAKAVELGHKLVSGNIKQQRIDAWCNHIESYPNAKLFCFRGGQRSQISQRWIEQAGKNIIRLDGGYRAFRRWLIEETERSLQSFKPIVLGGRTGSGKTILLKKMQNIIDLEALANHKGSSFGRHITPQPTQIDFENALAYELIRKVHDGHDTLVFEDEGKNVGRINVPTALADYLKEAPLVILETALPKRVEITFDEYVVIAQQIHKNEDTEHGIENWNTAIFEAMRRIHRRLGGLRYKTLLDMFDDAVAQQLATGSLESHKTWVEYLLVEYYDPMYDYQISKRADQVVFRGGEDEILELLTKEQL